MNVEQEFTREDSVKSEEDIDGDENEGGDYELWTEETVDIETPFTKGSQEDVEYLKLELAELKQILIALAEKFKLAEDKRKVAERRNSFLKADNLRLQQMSDTALSQKIEAEIENRKTLDKLREFINFKQEFEKQAELLKKIISHLPRMRNASTSCSKLLEKAEQCSGDGDALSATGKCTTANKNDESGESGDSNDNKLANNVCDENPSEIRPKEDQHIKIDKDGNMNNDVRTKESNYENQKIGNRNVQDGDDIKQTNYQQDFDEFDRTRIWNPKTKEEINLENAFTEREITAKKSSTKLAKLKQEVQALRNMNDWKSSDLEYKNRQLIVKNRELLQSRKEISQLKMQVNRLMIEQQKRHPNSSVMFSSNPSRIDITKKSKDNLSSSKMKIQQQNEQNKNNVSKQSEMKRNNRTQVQLPIQTDNPSLSTSSETMWQEIAPGDQIRIKIKKQTLEK